MEHIILTPWPATIFHFISSTTNRSPHSLHAACIPGWISQSDSPSGGLQRLPFPQCTTHNLEAWSWAKEHRGWEKKKKANPQYATVSKMFTLLQIYSKARSKLCFLKWFQYFSQPPLFPSLDNSWHSQQSNQSHYKAYIWNVAQGKLYRDS